MTSRTGKAMQRWAVALLCVAVAILLRWMMHPWLGERLALVTVYGAVALAAWYTGLWPAIGAAVVGYLVSEALFVEPDGRLSAGSVAAFAGLAAYYISCTIIIGFAERTRATQQRLEVERVRLQNLNAFHEYIADLTIDFGFSARVDADGTAHTDEVSDGFTKILGYTLDELRARGGWQVLIYPDDAAEADEAMRRLIKGEIVEGELRHVHKDGRMVWLRYRTRPIMDRNSGRVVRLYGAARDVTAQKQAATAAQFAEERFRHIADAAPVFIWTSDAENRLTWFNRPWLEFVGRPIERELDKGWLDNIHPEDRQRIIAQDQAAFDARQSAEMEYRLRRRDGTYRWILDRGVPTRDPHTGAFTGFVGSAIDVHDRRAAEQAVREAQHQLQIVTDAMSAAVTRCSRDLTYLWVSKPYANWLLQTPEQIIGRPIREVIGEAAFDRLRPYFDQVLSGQTVRYEEQVEFLGIGRRWVSVVYTPTFDDTGATDGWVALVIDIDSRRRAEEELKKADRMKDEFLATLAHELRNPLAPIAAAVDLLRMDHLDDRERLEAREIIGRQVRQLTRLVDDLLDVSRITHGIINVQKTRVSLERVIEDAVEASQPLISATAHKLTVSLPSDGPIYLEADEMRLSQVFLNLLNNAAKYTPRGGRIDLCAQRDGDHSAIVTVSDSGVGIAPDMLPRIFEMFTRVDQPMEQATGGLGIGLALSQRLVEVHGGSIEAISEGPGRGSRFVVRLPVLAGASPQPSPALDGDGAVPAPAACADGASKRRVLVVDDNVDAARMLARLLMMNGNSVETANDGEQALETAETFRPDAILLDIGLPKLSGYDVARRIRGQSWGQSVELVALTGWGQDDDRRRSAEAGFNHHLVKPVDFTVLTQLLSSRTAPGATS